MLVETEKGVPKCLIKPNMLLKDMMDTDRDISYNIHNIFITEDDGRKNQVISNIGQKEKVNITVTGQIASDYITDDFRVMYNGNELYMNGARELNLNRNVLNLTYYNVRVRSVYDYDNQSHIRKIYVDTSHPFYLFLRPLLVNQELIEPDDTGNIKIKVQDLTHELNGMQTLTGIEVPDYSRPCIKSYKWLTVKCKKGDNNGN